MRSAGISPAPLLHPLSRLTSLCSPHSALLFLVFFFLSLFILFFLAVLFCPSPLGGLSTLSLSVQGALLFFVILLVGTGWSFIKPFLTENEKKIVLVVVPLMLVDSVAVVIEDNLNEGLASILAPKVG